jgi:purine-nucleoside phosphorylase
MFKKIEDSVTCIAKYTSLKPTVGIILGSGLGAFSQELKIECKIPYSSIPHFALSSVEGHEGALLFGKINTVAVVVMQGRVHFYEGYSMDEITFPIRVLKLLGVNTLVISNAAGGMNPDFSIGDLMVISDHIHFMPNPLIGSHFSELGPRFPDMSQPYDQELSRLAFSIAEKNNLNLKKGIYVGVTGPTYETQAEYKLFRIMGGDAIGMSTTPEVIVARQMGIRCFALSVITDLGIPGKIEVLSHSMVTKAASDAEPQLAQLVRELILQLG